MHPILSQTRRLALYLLAWIPLAGILQYLLAYPGGLTWPKALAMVVPLCVIYAFACLFAWYPSRSTPLDTSGFSRLVLTHQAAAIVMGLFWVATAKGIALVLANFAYFKSLDQQIIQDYPLLLGSGVLIYLLSVALHYVWLASETSREAERREMQARVLARDSELKALKAQVNPHFIFNSLHSISALTTIDAAKAREMCIVLADFLRATLGLGEKTSITLADELSLVHSFLSVEKVRLGARLNLEEKIAPETLPCLVPPLLLQPLVENAVSHGIANLTGGGSVRLEVGQNDSGDISILVENHFDPDMPPRRGTGSGLRNVRQRLDTRYGTRATFDVRTEGDRFRVAISFPAERSESA